MDNRTALTISFSPDYFRFKGSISLEDLKVLIDQFYAQRVAAEQPRVEFAWGPSREQPSK